MLILKPTPNLRLNRTRILLAATAVILSLPFLALLLARRVPDPRYHGNKLSQLLDEADPTRSRLSGNSQQAALARAEALDALKELGPRAVPLLSKWLLERDSSFKANARNFCARFGLQPPSFLQCHSLSAVGWLMWIPQDAAPVAPLLLERLRRTPSLHFNDSVELLLRILNSAPGGDAKLIANSCLPLIPFLLTQAMQPLAFGSYEGQQFAISILQRASLTEADRDRFLQQIMAQAIKENSPWLGDRLADSLDPDYTLRNEILLRSAGPARQSSAALFFKENPVNTPRIVPLLRACLTSTNRNLVEQSANAIASYGPAAREALPDLTILTRTPNVRLSSAASNAILAIESPAVTVRR